MHSEIQMRIGRAITEKVFPGCVVGVVQKSGDRQVLSFGRFTYEKNSPEVRDESVYDLASITKSIPTASLAATLIESGKLRIKDSVKKYLPDLQHDHDATIEDLLCYRVHGTQLSKLPYKTFEEICTHALENGFDGPPEESVYTNLPAFLLGIIIERVGGSTLDRLAQKQFFDPLRMIGTSFPPNMGLRKSHIAPTEIDDRRGEVRGLPHDESAYVFTKAGRAVGHAGLFSTVPDLLNFLEALLQGTLPAVLEAAKRGLGWQTEGMFLGSQPRNRFGKTGFTGTSIVCDYERGEGFVILSNRTYPKRPPDGSAMNAVRSDIADIISRARLH